jgi:hypothetical protein
MATYFNRFRHALNLSRLNTHTNTVIAYLAKGRLSQLLRSGLTLNHTAGATGATAEPEDVGADRGAGG